LKIFVKGYDNMALHQLTQSQLDEIKATLSFLRNEKIEEVNEKVQEAKSQGDLSENSEYDAAREEQAKIHAEILRLESIVNNHEIIEGDSSIIQVGSHVKVYDETYDEDMEFDIVSPSVADPMNDKLSSESPIGAALIGLKRNNKVTVETPSGQIKLRIKSISKAK